MPLRGFASSPPRFCAFYHLHLPKSLPGVMTFTQCWIRLKSHLITPLFVPPTCIELKFKLPFSNWATRRLPAFESRWKYLCKLLRLSALLKGMAIYLNLTTNHSAETVPHDVQPEREASIKMFSSPADNTISHKWAINLQLCRNKM